MTPSNTKKNDRTRKVNSAMEGDHARAHPGHVRSARQVREREPENQLGQQSTAAGQPADGEHPEHHSRG